MSNPLYTAESPVVGCTNTVRNNSFNIVTVNYVAVQVKIRTIFVNFAEIIPTAVAIDENGKHMLARPEVSFPILALTVRHIIAHSPQRNVVLLA